MTKKPLQEEIDEKNAFFWNEICGESLARSLGINEFTVENLKEFDKRYFQLYPYLKNYIFLEGIADKKVLEIGLGFGTLGQYLAESGADYYGLDIASNPVKMMRNRLISFYKSVDDRIKEGSALSLPFPDETFDYVYSLGCFHHTGDIPKCINEIYRVLQPGGIAVIMMYNKYSFRAMIDIPLIWMRYRMSSKYKNKYKSFAELFAALFDRNSEGQGCPMVQLVSKSEVKIYFKKFRTLTINLENWGTFIPLLGLKIFKDIFSRFMGHDVYVVAVK